MIFVVVSSFIFSFLLSVNLTGEIPLGGDGLNFQASNPK